MVAGLAAEPAEGPRRTWRRSTSAPGAGARGRPPPADPRHRHRARASARATPSTPWRCWSAASRDVRFVWLMGADNLVQISTLGAVAADFHAGSHCGVRPPVLCFQGAGEHGGAAVRRRRRWPRLGRRDWRGESRRRGCSSTSVRIPASATLIRAKRVAAAGDRAARDDLRHRGFTNRGKLDIPATIDPSSGPTSAFGTKPTPDAAALLSVVTASLDDNKAEDVVVIDLNGKTSIADYMVIACGTSQRHVGSMAEQPARAAEGARRQASVSVEGRNPLRLGADRRRRRRRPPVPARGPRRSTRSSGCGAGRAWPRQPRRWPRPVPAEPARSAGVGWPARHCVRRRSVYLLALRQCV